jgi:hypothetical protein
MRKISFIPFVGLICAILCTGYSPKSFKLGNPVKSPSCSLSVTFYNTSPGTTISSIFMGDLAGNDDTDTNIGPGNSSILTINYTTGGIEFNVEFPGSHPGGRVRLIETTTSTVIACTVVAKNLSVITVQVDSSPNCSNVYELRYETVHTCP